MVQFYYHWVAYTIGSGFMTVNHGISNAKALHHFVKVDPLLLLDIIVYVVEKQIQLLDDWGNRCMCTGRYIIDKDVVLNIIIESVEYTRVELL